MICADKIVAPHAGSVDRNDVNKGRKGIQKVAPHAGSVDRNDAVLLPIDWPRGRSPRGERG